MKPLLVFEASGSEETISLHIVGFADMMSKAVGGCEFIMYARSWAVERTLCQPVGPVVDCQLQGCKGDRSVLQRVRLDERDAASIDRSAVGLSPQDAKPDRVLGGAGTIVCSPRWSS